MNKKSKTTTEIKVHDSKNKVENLKWVDPNKIKEVTPVHVLTLQTWLTRFGK